MPPLVDKEPDAGPFPSVSHLAAAPPENTESTSSNSELWIRGLSSEHSGSFSFSPANVITATKVTQVHTLINAPTYPSDWQGERDGKGGYDDSEVNPNIDVSNFSHSDEHDAFMSSHIANIVVSRTFPDTSSNKSTMRREGKGSFSSSSSSSSAFSEGNKIVTLVDDKVIVIEEKEHSPKTTSFSSSELQTSSPSQVDEPPRNLVDCCGADRDEGEITKENINKKYHSVWSGRGDASLAVTAGKTVVGVDLGVDDAHMGISAVTKNDGAPHDKMVSLAPCTPLEWSHHNRDQLEFTANIGKNIEKRKHESRIYIGNQNNNRNKKMEKEDTVAAMTTAATLITSTFSTSTNQVAQSKDKRQGQSTSVSLSPSVPRRRASLRPPMFYPYGQTEPLLFFNYNTPCNNGSGGSLSSPTGLGSGGFNPSTGFSNNGVNAFISTNSIGGTVVNAVGNETSHPSSLGFKWTCKYDPQAYLDFNKEIKVFVKVWLLLTPEERKQRLDIVKLIGKLARKSVSLNSQMRFYGSFVTGFALSDSDVDVLLSDYQPVSLYDAIMKLANALVQYEGPTSLEIGQGTTTSGTSPKSKSSSEDNEGSGGTGKNKGDLFPDNQTHSCSSAWGTSSYSVLTPRRDEMQSQQQQVSGGTPLQDPSRSGLPIRTLTESLYTGPCFTVKPVLYTRVPILMVTHILTGIKIDISFGRGEHEQSMNLVGRLMRYSAGRYLVIMLKFLLREACLTCDGTNHWGGVRSFVLYLLVIHFLRVRFDSTMGTFIEPSYDDVCGPKEQDEMMKLLEKGLQKAIGDEPPPAVSQGIQSFLQNDSNGNMATNDHNEKPTLLRSDSNTAKMKAAQDDDVCNGCGEMVAADTAIASVVIDEIMHKGNEADVVEKVVSAEMDIGMRKEGKFNIDDDIVVERWGDPHDLNESKCQQGSDNSVVVMEAAHAPISVAEIDTRIEDKSEERNVTDVMNSSLSTEQNSEEIKKERSRVSRSSKFTAVQDKQEIKADASILSLSADGDPPLIPLAAMVSDLETITINKSKVVLEETDQYLKNSLTLRLDIQHDAVYPSTSLPQNFHEQPTGIPLYASSCFPNLEDRTLSEEFDIRTTSTKSTSPLPLTSKVQNEQPPLLVTSQLREHPVLLPQIPPHPREQQQEPQNQQQLQTSSSSENKKTFQISQSSSKHVICPRDDINLAVDDLKDDREIGELLLLFCYYYSTFDYKTKAIAFDVAGRSYVRERERPLPSSRSPVRRPTPFCQDGQRCAATEGLLTNGGNTPLGCSIDDATSQFSGFNEAMLNGRRHKAYGLPHMSLYSPFNPTYDMTQRMTETHDMQILFVNLFWTLVSVQNLPCIYKSVVVPTSPLPLQQLKQGAATSTTAAAYLGESADDNYSNNINTINNNINKNGANESNSAHNTTTPTGGNRSVFPESPIGAELETTTTALVPTRPQLHLREFLLNFMKICSDNHRVATKTLRDVIMYGDLSSRNRMFRVPMQSYSPYNVVQNVQYGGLVANSGMADTGGSAGGLLIAGGPHCRPYQCVDGGGGKWRAATALPYRVGNPHIGGGGPFCYPTSGSHTPYYNMRPSCAVPGTPGGGAGGGGGDYAGGNGANAGVHGGGLRPSPTTVSPMQNVRFPHPSQRAASHGHGPAGNNNGGDNCNNGNGIINTAGKVSSHNNNVKVSRDSYNQDNKHDIYNHHHNYQRQQRYSAIEGGGTNAGTSPQHQFMGDARNPLLVAHYDPANNTTPNSIFLYGRGGFENQNGGTSAAMGKQKISFTSLKEERIMSAEAPFIASSEESGEEGSSEGCGNDAGERSRRSGGSRIGVAGAISCHHTSSGAHPQHTVLYSNHREEGSRNLSFNYNSHGESTAELSQRRGFHHSLRDNIFMGELMNPGMENNSINDNDNLYYSIVAAGYTKAPAMPATSYAQVVERGGTGVGGNVSSPAGSGGALAKVEHTMSKSPAKHMDPTSLPTVAVSKSTTQGAAGKRTGKKKVKVGQGGEKVKQEATLRYADNVSTGGRSSSGTSSVSRKGDATQHQRATGVGSPVLQGTAGSNAFMTGVAPSPLSTSEFSKSAVGVSSIVSVGVRNLSNTSPSSVMSKQQISKGNVSGSTHNNHQHQNNNNNGNKHTSLSAIGGTLPGPGTSAPSPAQGRAMSSAFPEVIPAQGPSGVTGGPYQLSGSPLVYYPTQQLYASRTGQYLPGAFDYATRVGPHDGAGGAAGIPMSFSHEGVGAPTGMNDMSQYFYNQQYLDQIQVLYNNNANSLGNTGALGGTPGGVPYMAQRAYCAPHIQQKRQQRSPLLQSHPVVQTTWNAGMQAHTSPAHQGKRHTRQRDS